MKARLASGSANAQLHHKLRHDRSGGIRLIHRNPLALSVVLLSWRSCPIVGGWISGPLGRRCGEGCASLVERTPVKQSKEKRLGDSSSLLLMLNPQVSKLGGYTRTETRYLPFSKQLAPSSCRRDMQYSCFR